MLCQEAPKCFDPDMHSGAFYYEDQSSFIVKVNKLCKKTLKGTLILQAVTYPFS